MVCMISKFSSDISINLFLRSVVILLLVFTGCPGKEYSSMILCQMSEQTKRQRTQFWQPFSHLSPSRATRQPVAPAWHLQLSHFKRMPSLRQSTPVAFLQVKASLSLGTMMAANRIANNIGRAIFWRAMSVFEEWNGRWMNVILIGIWLGTLLHFYSCVQLMNVDNNKLNCFPNSLIVEWITIRFWCRDGTQGNKNVLIIGSLFKLKITLAREQCIWPICTETENIKCQICKYWWCWANYPVILVVVLLDKAMGFRI